MSYYQLQKSFFPTYNKAHKEAKRLGVLDKEIIFEITITDATTRPKKAKVQRWLNWEMYIPQENTESQDEVKTSSWLSQVNE